MPGILWSFLAEREAWAGSVDRPRSQFSADSQAAQGAGGSPIRTKKKDVMTFDLTALNLFVVVVKGSGFIMSFSVMFLNCTEDG